MNKVIEPDGYIKIGIKGDKVVQCDWSDLEDHTKLTIIGLLQMTINRLLIIDET